ncbi:hypothetical protein GOP47_0004781 [Adiantum capillus-veneris]|uniref:non-specific serine/threonine protein kinase n=1 Tax=Adiantum capillus-veneris TaxID=13818 RepID=A0A9D4V5G8_ADICA|nr:hypothetical protein GOP47_0004781 [Adiantum capillus-veneris]
MGNACCCCTDSAASDPVHTGTTNSYAGTSSKFTSFSQDKSSLEISNGSTPSGTTHRPHSISTSIASLKAFSYNDLKAATRNFRPESFLGEGGFGIVYKGYVDEHTLVPSRPGQGMAIAIKKLKLEGVQGHREWLAEVHYLGALHHPNLVKLIGFCAEDCNRLLVYEYMPRGSLENHLFRKGRHIATMPWETRMRIAVGAAKGLAFLHVAERQVIYRDFKASNILLDNQYNAKLSDFGLAKDGPMGDDTHVSTRIMGTYGYAAPEYLATGHLSARSDVYSFGVVLLEILTGLKTVDNNRPSGEEKLVDWAKPCLDNKRQMKSQNRGPPWKRSWIPLNSCRVLGRGRCKIHG